MYTRMLVALDGSKTAENVLPYARSLAKALKIPVQLISVIEIGHYTSDARASYLDSLIDAAIRRNQEYLQRVAKTFPSASVGCTVEAGVPEEVIITKAAENRGNLIAMATHGRSGFNRWLLGSVAEKVVASNPVLLVRGIEDAKTEGEMAPERVIVPLDGSQLAEAVMPIVVELAKAANLKIVLLRTFSVPPIMYSISHEDFLHALNNMLTELKSEATSYLDKTADQLKSKGLADVVQIVSDGEPAETIIELARGAPNSLIVMCTHGHSGVKSWVFGSVTEKVVRHGGNPVLVIRGL